MMRVWVFLAVLLVLSSVSAVDLPENVQKVYDYQTERANQVTFLIAFLAGIITFTSPCSFVLLPTFFAVAFRKKALRIASAFGLGLMLSFTLFGIIAGFIGSFFGSVREIFAVVSGILIVGFGVLLLARKSFFNTRLPRPESLSSAMSIGFLFGFGWTPCVGPVLGSIIVLAANLSVFKGALLLATYALGVMVPLLFLSGLATRFNVEKYVRPSRGYAVISAFFLISVGLIMIFNQGTAIVMETIPEYLPWNMAFFVAANNYLLQNSIVWVFSLVVIFLLFLIFLVRKCA